MLSYPGRRDANIVIPSFLRSRSSTGLSPEVHLPLCGIVIFSRQPESLPHLPRLHGRLGTCSPIIGIVSDFAREALHTPVCLRIPCFLQDRLFRHAAHGDGSSIRTSSPFSPLHRITLNWRRGVDIVLARTIILGLMWGVERSGVAVSSERSEGPMRKLFHTDDAWTGFILRMTVGLVMFPMARRRCWLVRWLWIRRHDGILRKRWASLDRRVSGHHRGVLRQPRVAGGSVDARHRRQFHRDHAGSHSDCACAGRFFMNWFGQQQGEGYEYHLLVIGMAAALLMTGSRALVTG